MLDNCPKLVAVGEAGVGKTSFMRSYPADLIIKGKHKRVKFWETSADEKYDRLRPLAYPNTDVFLLCFAVNDRFSFDNISLRWLPELQGNCWWSDARILIIGCKGDVRQTQADVCIPYDEIREKCTEWGLTYYETSALDKAGLTKPMDECFNVYQDRPKISHPKAHSLRRLLHRLKAKFQTKTTSSFASPTPPGKGTKQGCGPRCRTIVLKETTCCCWFCRSIKW